MSKIRSYFFAGINGVGKTTLLNAIQSSGANVEIFKGSAKLMELLQLQPGDYVSLRALPDQIKEQAVNVMMETVLTTDVGNDAPVLLVDAHLINYKRGEMRDATGPWMRHLNALFIVMASPEVILTRVQQDAITNIRHRDLLPEGITPLQEVEWIDRYLDVTLKRGSEISGEHGVPVFKIVNDMVPIETAVEQFYNIHAHLHDLKSENYVHNFK